MIIVNGKQITVSTNEIYPLDFLEEVVLNRSSKGAITSSFCRAPCLISPGSKMPAKLTFFSKLLSK